MVKARPIITFGNSREALENLLLVAEALSRAELIVALREPQRKLVTLLHNRSHDLKEGEKELAELEEILDNPHTWGDW